VDGPRRREVPAGTHSTQVLNPAMPTPCPAHPCWCGLYRRSCTSLQDRRFRASEWRFKQAWGT
jgi:hypothetical protein